MGSTVVQAIINGLLIGGIYALIGMGLNIIFGVMKIINFCQGELLMLGMYLSYFLNTYLGLDPYISFPLVAIIMFGVGAALQAGLITPSLKSSEVSNILFITIGLGLFLQNFALIVFRSDYRSLNTSYSQKTLDLFGHTVSLTKLISFGATIVITALLFLLLKYTQIGKQIRATSQNMMGARLVGIRTNWVYAATCGIGVAITGIAGSFLLPFFYVFPTVGAAFGMMGFIAVIIGGLGSIQGACLAGLVVGVLETLGSFVVGPALKDTVVFISFILILVVRQNLKIRQG